MNKILLTVAFYILWCVGILAAVPQVMDYQIMAINPNTGAIMANKDIDLTIAVHAGSASGEVLWSKTETVKTSKTGLCTMTLDFSDMNWNRGELFITVSADGVDLGANQIKSVPYAITASRLDDFITEEELIGKWVIDSYWDYGLKLSHTFYKNGIYERYYESGGDEHTEHGTWKLISGQVVTNIYGSPLGYPTLYDREKNVLYLTDEGYFIPYYKQ